MRIGVISDTHGLLRPEVFEVFQAVDHIVHGGDVGPASILDELATIAPVTAVYGNTDGWDLRGRLPQVARLELDGFTIVVTHGDQFGSPTPEKLQAAFPDAEIIVYGHTHRPLLTLVDVVVTVMNPGGAGAAPVRSAALGGHPGARAGHSAAGPAGAAHAGSTRTSRCSARSSFCSRSVRRLRRCGRHAVRPLDSASRPPPDGRIDSLRGARPRSAFRRGRGSASIWLLRAADTVFVAAAIPDRTRAWDDGAGRLPRRVRRSRPAPAHDDFQWSLQRALDSSVVYRGRGGRWTPPLDDPDWRLGAARGGGGWEVTGIDGEPGWTVVLRLDPAWWRASAGRRPAIGFRIHDDDPNAWYSWPARDTSAGATLSSGRRRSGCR